MRTKSRIVLQVSAAISVIAFAGVSPSMAPNQNGGDAQDSAAQRLGARVTDLVVKWSALGTYFDTKSGEHVIVMPAQVPLPSIEEARASMGGALRVEQSSITAESIKQVQARLVARDFHPQAKNYRYGSYFDASRDRLVIATNAPADVTAPLRMEYPDVIAVHR